MKYFFLLFACLFFVACAEDKPTVSVFTPVQRQEIDTLTAHRIKEISGRLDSECLNNFDSALRASVDSIKNLRLQQIGRQMQDVH